MRARPHVACCLLACLLVTKTRPELLAAALHPLPHHYPPGSPFVCGYRVCPMTHLNTSQSNLSTRPGGGNLNQTSHAEKRSRTGFTDIRVSLRPTTQDRDPLSGSSLERSRARGSPSRLASVQPPGDVTAPAVYIQSSTRPSVQSTNCRGGDLDGPSYHGGCQQLALTNPSSMDPWGTRIPHRVNLSLETGERPPLRDPSR